MTKPHSRESVVSNETGDLEEQLNTQAATIFGLMTQNCALTHRIEDIFHAAAKAQAMRDVPNEFERALYQVITNAYFVYVKRDALTSSPSQSATDTTRQPKSVGAATATEERKTWSVKGSTLYHGDQAVHFFSEGVAVAKIVCEQINASLVSGGAPQTKTDQQIAKETAFKINHLVETWSSEAGGNRPPYQSEEIILSAIREARQQEKAGR